MNKCNEQRFEQIFELCVYINLFELLNRVTAKIYAEYGSRCGLNRNRDISSLLLCNKHLNKILTTKMIKCAYFSMSGIERFFEKRNFYENNVHKLCIDTSWNRGPLHVFQKLSCLTIWYDDNLDDLFIRNQTNRSSRKSSLINLPNITELTFGYYYRKPIKKNTLPTSITKLTFGVLV